MAKAPIEIKSLARAHTDKAIRVLAGIMSEPDAPHAARVAAAQALLDRGWGKATQHIEAQSINRYVIESPPAPADRDEWVKRYAPQTAIQ